jgi:hypothetical protein
VRCCFTDVQNSKLSNTDSELASGFPLHFTPWIAHITLRLESTSRDKFKNSVGIFQSAVFMTPQNTEVLPLISMAYNRMLVALKISVESRRSHSPSIENND